MTSQHMTAHIWFAARKNYKKKKEEDEMNYLIFQIKIILLTRRIYCCPQNLSINYTIILVHYDQ